MTATFEAPESWGNEITDVQVFFDAVKPGLPLHRTTKRPNGRPPIDTWLPHHATGALPKSGSYSDRHVKAATCFFVDWDAGADETVADVRIGKYMELRLELDDPDVAEEAVARMCDQLLSNPVIEDFRFTLEPYGD